LRGGKEPRQQVVEPLAYEVYSGDRLDLPRVYLVLQEIQVPLPKVIQKLLISVYAGVLAVAYWGRLSEWKKG
jgi:hypothetical protein